MNAPPEDIKIKRDSDGRPRDVICAIGLHDLDVRDIFTARIGIQIEHVMNGVVVCISNSKERTKTETCVTIRRSPRGDLISLGVVIAAGDLWFVEPDDILLEKTVTQVAGELIVRFTAKKGSEGMGLS